MPNNDDDDDDDKIVSLQLPLQLPGALSSVQGYVERWIESCEEDEVLVQY